MSRGDRILMDNRGKLGARRSLLVSWLLAFDSCPPPLSRVDLRIEDIGRDLSPDDGQDVIHGPSGHGFPGLIRGASDVRKKDRILHFEELGGNLGLRLEDVEPGSRDPS